MFVISSFFLICCITFTSGLVFSSLRGRGGTSGGDGNLEAFDAIDSKAVE